MRGSGGEGEARAIIGIRMEDVKAADQSEEEDESSQRCGDLADHVELGLGVVPGTIQPVALHRARLEGVKRFNLFQRILGLGVEGVGLI